LFDVFTDQQNSHVNQFGIESRKELGVIVKDPAEGSSTAAGVCDLLLVVVVIDLHCCIDYQRIGDRAFSVAAPRACNRLPTELKLLRSADLFRRDLKTFLFYSVYGHQDTD